MKKILIAGGSGLVGKQLSKLLSQNNYEVAWLSRSNKSSANFPSYKWNPEAGVIDPEAIAFADVIIVLSGENIAAERWTNNFKKKIITSRLQAAKTISNALKNHPNNVTHVIAASAIGFYGDRKDNLVDELSDKGIGFLADTTQQWENAYSDFTIPIANIRIGVVLSKAGGALVEMSLPVKWGIASPLGNGQQFISWIHIDDLTGLFMHVMQNQLTGIYNAVASNPVTNEVFTYALKKSLSKNAISLPTPAWAMKLLLGEKSAIVLDSTRVSNKKIIESGFTFKYEFLEQALKNFYGK
ncbi:MAG: hypothetical protein RL516_971 [Bacteroidota bacterium]|jgi:uncharacterized protein (TIGR01777 family)